MSASHRSGQSYQIPEELMSVYVPGSHSAIQISRPAIEHTEAWTRSLDIGLKTPLANHKYSCTCLFPQNTHNILVQKWNLLQHKFCIIIWGFLAVNKDMRNFFLSREIRHILSSWNGVFKVGQNYQELDSSLNIIGRPYCISRLQSLC